MAGNTVPAIIDIKIVPALNKEMEHLLALIFHNFLFLSPMEIQLVDGLTASRMIGGTQGTPSFKYYRVGV